MKLASSQISKALLGLKTQKSALKKKRRHTLLNIRFELMIFSDPTTPSWPSVQKPPTSSSKSGQGEQRGCWCRIERKRFIARLIDLLRLLLRSRSVIFSWVLVCGVGGLSVLSKLGVRGRNKGARDETIKRSTVHIYFLLVIYTMIFNLPKKEV